MAETTKGTSAPLTSGDLAQIRRHVETFGSIGPREAKRLLGEIDRLGALVETLGEQFAAAAGGSDPPSRPLEVQCAAWEDTSEGRSWCDQPWGHITSTPHRFTIRERK
jgi:hypothetical protein